MHTGGSREVGLGVVLALQALIMFILVPLAAMHVFSPLLLDISRMALAAAAVMLLARSRLVSAAITATFMVSVVLSLSFQSSSAAQTLALERCAALTAFDLAIAWAVATVAFGQGRVSAYRVMGAVILYLSIALVFANAYRACALLLNSAFAGPAANGADFLNHTLYFSLSTLTTTGYGDITPVHPLVRSLANLEAVIGQLFPATLLARLVTLHAAGEAPRP
jgi:hypothetical protein